MKHRGYRLGVAAAAAVLGSLGLASGAIADPAPGNFVIGDQNAVLGGQVTFWGSQWWKDNQLTGGDAPAAFKGFADSGATCGQAWATRPGNSSEPPAAVGAVIPVIVSSAISKAGPVIAGDTTEVVFVRVDPGYAGDPGHPGTGTVIGFACGGGIIAE